MGPSLWFDCQSKIRYLGDPADLLGIYFVLETSFKGLRDSVSTTFEDDELATSSSGSCRSTI